MSKVVDKKIFHNKVQFLKYCKSVVPSVDINESCKLYGYGVVLKNGDIYRAQTLPNLCRILNTKLGFNFYPELCRKVTSTMFCVVFKEKELVVDWERVLGFSDTDEDKKELIVYAKGLGIKLSPRAKFVNLIAKFKEQAELLGFDVPVEDVVVEQEQEAQDTPEDVVEDVVGTEGEDA